MANTYTLINSTSLSSSAASVTFSAIPATYDDLLLSLSLRSSGGTTGGSGWIRFNGLSTSIYSGTELRGNGATASSSSFSANSILYFNYYVGGTGTTASTFSSTEIYIPKYTSTAAKPSSAFNAHETNATTAYLSTLANLTNLTSAITSIQINCDSGDWVSGSTFWLYGIKNS